MYPSEFFECIWQLYTETRQGNVFSDVGTPPVYLPVPGTLPVEKLFILSDPRSGQMPLSRASPGVAESALYSISTVCLASPAPCLHAPPISGLETSRPRDGRHQFADWANGGMWECLVLLIPPASVTGNASDSLVYQ